MQYVYAKVDPGPYACRLGALHNVNKKYELKKGISRQDNWPKDAFFEMSEDFEDDIKTEDFISNTTSVLVVSEKVKDLLADMELKNNEWLSVSIINHRKRKIKTPYFILHQLNLQDCIDLEQSVFKRNALDPDLFLVIERLMISEQKIEKSLAIFRMHHYPFVCLFHRGVAEKIRREACTGIEFRELEDWEPS